MKESYRESLASNSGLGPYAGDGNIAGVAPSFAKALRRTGRREETRASRPCKGGFCCVPGSHKAEFDSPKHYFETLLNPHVRQISPKAGSCVAFTEALTHGTYPAGHEAERRSILLRLTPGGVQFRRPPDQRPARSLPAIFRRIDPLPIDNDSLDDCAKSLLPRPASLR